MAWNRQAVKEAADTILREARIIWPPHTEHKDGFESVEDHGHIKALRRKLKALPLNDRDYRALKAWISEIGDDLKAWGIVAEAAKKHPKNWNRIVSAIRTIRDKAGLS